jgi:hypothetical protein
VYVPGGKSSVNALAPARKVGVAPITLRLLVAIVRLCGSPEWFVKAILTSRLRAISSRLLNVSCLLGLAASASHPVGSGPDGGVESDPSVDAPVLVVEAWEAPQPASANSMRSAAAVKGRLMSRSLRGRGSLLSYVPTRLTTPPSTLCSPVRHHRGRSVEGLNRR